MDQQHLYEEEPVIDAKVVARLSSKREDVRRAAEESLEKLGPQKVEVLLSLLKEESRKRRKRRRTMTYIMVGYAGILGLVVIGYVAHGLFTGQWGQFPFQIFQQAGMFGGLASAYALSAAQRNATKRIAQDPDVRAVGYLAEALESRDVELRPIASATLIELLPRLTASDAHLLDDHQQAVLYQVLSAEDRQRANRIARRGSFVPGSEQKKLRLAILKALAQVGDEKALPYVETLADGGYPAGQDADIVAAANECLPFLTARVEQERAAHTLLRAAASPEAPADILLRPAHGSGETDPALLLRASTENPDRIDDRQETSA